MFPPFEVGGDQARRPERPPVLDGDERGRNLTGSGVAREFGGDVFERPVGVVPRPLGVVPRGEHGDELRVIGEVVELHRQDVISP